MRRFTDQMGRDVALKLVPKRIVSLVPSQTELLYYLGVPPIAQTVFCIHPSPEFKTAQKIGGTKKLHLDEIKDLKPDLIIGNKEENVREQIEELAQHFPVWMSDVNSLEDALKMIEDLGEVIGKSSQAAKLSHDIFVCFSRLLTGTKRKNFIYLIWRDPYFGVASNTFIHDILQRTGLTNALSEYDRYPELSTERIVQINPDIIFLSSEPYPFKEQHQKELQELLPNSRIEFVDGELCSWYGNRLLKTPNYLAKLVEGLK